MPEADYRLMTEETGGRIAEALESITAMQGPKGDTGATGPQGPAGPQGPKGDTGEIDQATLDALDAAINNKLDKDFSGLTAANTFSSTDIIPISVTVNNVTTTYKLTGATLAVALSSIGNYLTASDLPLALANGGLGVDFSAAGGAGFHNSINRGKYLGNALTNAQSASIIAGEFDDMFVGDYWTIDNEDYVIADCDPYYRCGDNMSLGHHVAVIPRGNMASAAWNVGSNDTSKMYAGSDIRIVTIQGQESGSTPNVDSTDGVQGRIISAFGSSHVLKYRALYPSAQSSGSATSWAWVDARVELLSEIEVYGTVAWTDGGKGNGHEVGINMRQLSIFRLNPGFMNNRAYWWLRSVSSASYACHVHGYCYASHNPASLSFGVRPFSLIA